MTNVSRARAGWVALAAAAAIAAGPVDATAQMFNISGRDKGEEAAAEEVEAPAAAETAPSAPAEPGLIVNPNPAATSEAGQPSALAAEAEEEEESAPLFRLRPKQGEKKINIDLSRPAAAEPELPDESEMSEFERLGLERRRAARAKARFGGSSPSRSGLQRFTDRHWSVQYLDLREICDDLNGRHSLSTQIDACTRLLRWRDQLARRELASIYNNRGVAYDTQGRYRQAIADYDAALALDPRFQAARVNRRAAFRAIGAVPPTEFATPVSFDLSRTEAEELGLDGRNLDRGSVARLQRALTELGYDPGPIDGVWGPRTRRAFETWRASR